MFNDVTGALTFHLQNLIQSVWTFVPRFENDSSCVPEITLTIPHNGQRAHMRPLSATLVYHLPLTEKQTHGFQDKGLPGKAEINGPLCGHLNSPCCLEKTFFCLWSFLPLSITGLKKITYKQKTTS